VCGDSLKEEGSERQSHLPVLLRWYMTVSYHHREEEGGVRRLPVLTGKEGVSYIHTRREGASLHTR
jgi:hypothetical protein